MNTVFVMHFLGDTPPELGTQKPSADDLHVTFLAHVSYEEEPQITELVTRIGQVAAKTQPFTLTVGELDFFGVNHNIPVKRISGEIIHAQALHMNLLVATFAAGLFSKEPANHLGDKFSPHVSLPLNHDAIKAGTEIHVNHFSLVEHIGGYGSSKIRVVKNFSLL